MRTLGRLMQIAGLSIPLLAIVAQLNESITQGQMLMFLIAAVCAFWIGRIVEGFARTV